MNLSIGSSGLAGTNQSFIIRDDPGDSSYFWDNATGTANLNLFSSPCCNDGWVLGLLPDSLISHPSGRPTFPGVLQQGADGGAVVVA